MANIDRSGRSRSAAKGALGIGAGVAATLGAGAAGAAILFRRVNEIGRFPEAELARLRQGRQPELFATFPGLAARIPWRPLGAVPTPVEELPAPIADTGNRYYVKRDDLSSPLYGGNKVRKLEFLLAEAELAGRRTLITLGGTGSNHALATAMHGVGLGFRADLVLYDQPVTPFVRRNLGGFVDAGATLHYGGSIPRSFWLAGRLFMRRKREGAAPYFIMVGGSSRLGVVGHVSAALELARQIRDGLLPEPDRVFVPLGTCGTAAGLIVGLRLAGLRTRVCAVRVADPFPANPAVLRWMAQDVADFLRAADSTVPEMSILATDFDVLTAYFGRGYGYPTGEGEAAVDWVAPHLAIETTYTAKALAACLDFGSRSGPPSTLLFWNTFSSAPLPDPADWPVLPPPLARIVMTSRRSP